MSDQIKRAYKQSKGIYDDVLTGNKWWSRLYLRFFWGVNDFEVTEKLFELLPEDFAGTLLDVPCGTLNLTADHYRKRTGWAITGLDYSEDMLAGARARLEEGGLSHVSLVQGDVGNLPFEDNSLDAVLSMNGFHVFPEKEQAYGEIARVLRPGGLFLGCFYIEGERRRSDFVVRAVLSKKGWFTPPFQTKAQVRASLQQHYSRVEQYSQQAMVWFRCVK